MCLSLLLPEVRYNGNPEETDLGGYAGEAVPFRAAGADDGVWVCVY